MFEMIKKNRNKVIFIVVFLLIGVPFIVHCLFKIKSTNSFWAAEWTAGEFLTYYGAALSFTATVILSFLALWQNELIREESNKHTYVLEEMERRKICPFFTVVCNYEGINHSDMRIAVRNITDNMALDVSIIEVGQTLNGQQEFHKSYPILAPWDVMEVDLENGFLEEKDLVQLNISCKDIYGNENSFLAQGKYDSDNSVYCFVVIKLRAPQI